MTPCARVLVAAMAMATMPGALRSAARHEPDASPQVFRARTDLVSVDVSVRAGSTAVTDLTSGDFELLDNGVAQRIEAVSVEEIPVDLTLLLDTSSSTAGVIARFKANAQQLASMLRSDDRVRLIAFSDAVTEVFPLQGGSGRLPVESLQARGGTALHEALLLALARRPDAGRRQLLVAFTDGADTTSVVDAATVASVARRAECVLHLVLSPVYGAESGTPLPTERTLRDTAEATGGELHRPGAFGDAVDAFREVFRDFRQSYVLRYSAQGVAHDGWHEIKVRVTREGRFTVRARKGYVGG
jgi:VWFA-related protein